MKFKVALLPFLFIGALHVNAQNTTFSCPANIVVKADNGKEGAMVSFPAPAAELGAVTYTPASGSFSGLARTVWWLQLPMARNVLLR